LSAVTTKLRTQFFDYIFGPQQEGYLCLASTIGLVPSGAKDFRQVFFEWPKQKNEIASFVDSTSESRNMYFCTSLLSKGERLKENCLPGNLLWSDLDFVNPTGIAHPPSLVVESSPQRYQAFWRLDEELPADVIEDLNRRLAYSVGADKSGWDLTQLMRIPHTRNFKYVDKPEVAVVGTPSAVLVPLQPFLELPDPLVPAQNGTGIDLGEPMPDMITLPNADNIIYAHRNELSRQEGFSILYGGDPDENADWSKLLWRLINVCIESGMDKQETFAIAYSAKCNKYIRDNRPPQYLWKEVLKAWLNQKHIAVLVDDQLVELSMPEMVAKDLEEDSFVKDYKAWGESATDAPVQYHELCCFMALSCVISAGLRLKLDWGKLAPNIWGMILGESTLTRKTTAMRMAMDIVSGLDEELILATDGSPEGLLTSLGERPKRVSIFYKDEISGFFDSINRKDYLAGLPETFTQLYDVPAVLRRVLKKETVTINEPYFIFFGGGIRDKVYSLLTEEYVLSGFIPRFLVVSGENDLARIRRTGPPSAHTDELKRKVVNSMGELKVMYNLKAAIALENLHQEVLVPVEIEAKLTDDAWTFFGDCEMMLIRAADESPISMMAMPTFQRLAFSMLKMALLIAASRREYKDNELRVEKNDVEQAAWYIQKWGRYSIELISQAGKPSGERIVERMYQMIRREPGILKSALMRRHHLNSRELKEFTETLIDRGLIEHKKVAQGHRYYPVG
jgi:hypothetical protein